MGDLVLTIDAGLSAAKSAAIDARGGVLGHARRAYPVEGPEGWWASSRACVAEVLRQVDADRIAAVCATALAPALVAVSTDGGVCTPPRPDDFSRLDALAGFPARFTVMPALASLAERDPAAYARVRWGLQPYEFMAWKLSGEAVSIPHPGREEWFSRETYQKVGLDPEKLPERKCPAGDVIGPVSRLLSLPESAVVVAGTIDTFSAWLGTATLDAGIMCMTTGTTTCLGLVWPTGPNPHLAGGGRQVFSTALPQGSTMESARQVIREWESLGARVSEIRLAGGGSADDVLNQSRAEVFGRPVIAPEVPDSGLVGAAALGAWALGWYGNIEAASRAMARARRRFDP